MSKIVRDRKLFLSLYVWCSKSALPLPRDPKRKLMNIFCTFAFLKLNRNDTSSLVFFYFCIKQKIHLNTTPELNIGMPEAAIPLSLYLKWFTRRRKFKQRDDRLWKRATAFPPTVASPRVAASTQLVFSATVLNGSAFALVGNRSWMAVYSILWEQLSKDLFNVNKIAWQELMLNAPAT